MTEPTNEKYKAYPAFHFLERIGEAKQTKVCVDKILYSGKTKWQDVKVVSIPKLGNTLILDHHTQSADKDEKIYHQALVHPALLSHPNPKKVFIGGGGEGATARECLRHKGVEKVVMLDLDPEVVELCRKYMPKSNEGVFEDPRFTCVYQDARQYLRECGEKFDVIIMDINDPIDGGPGWYLYTKEFYAEVGEKYLTDDGVFVTQSTSTMYEGRVFQIIYNTLKASFSQVSPYCTGMIESFSEPWAFNIATNSKNHQLFDKSTPVDEVDKRIKDAINVGELEEYDGETHRGMFNMSKSIRNGFEETDEVYTTEKPKFFI